MRGHNKYAEQRRQDVSSPIALPVGVADQLKRQRIMPMEPTFAYQKTESAQANSAVFQTDRGPLLLCYGGFDKVEEASLRIAAEIGDPNNFAAEQIVAYACAILDECKRVTDENNARIAEQRQAAAAKEAEEDAGEQTMNGKIDTGESKSKDGEEVTPGGIVLAK